MLKTIIIILNLVFVLPFIIVLFMLLFNFNFEIGQVMASAVLFGIGLFIYIIIGSAEEIK